MPFKSQKQRAAMYAKAERGEIPRSVVEEFARSTKGKKLPKTAKKKTK